MTDEQFTIGSLFTGIRGLDLAVEAITGGQVIWHSEVDKHASRVLAQHCPTIPNLGDVRKIDWTTVPAPDILCGGFPCQDISTAGMQAGIQEGTRSGLWFRFADAIHALRPGLVVVENVEALITLGLGTVLGSLASLGYDAEWGVLPLSAIGGVHRRGRVFLIAWPTATNPARYQQRESTIRRLRPELGERPEGSLWGEYRKTIRAWERVIGRFTPKPLIGTKINVRFMEWMQGFEDGWVAGSSASRTQQIKMLGNAVVPQQAEIGIRGLLTRVEGEVMSDPDAVVDAAKHPAKFSEPILTGIRQYLDNINFAGIILDPFAGVGLVHQLGTGARFTVGVELEPEWANQHESNMVGDSRDLQALGFAWGEVQAIVTSCTYGNRMADSHTPGPEDTSTRHTYTHTLGRKLSEGNTGAMQWGGVNSQYRKVHRQVWEQCMWVLEDGGLFVLNVSDHYRKGKRQFVTAWHKATLASMGIEWGPEVRIETRRQKHGANGSLRMPYESVLIGVKRELDAGPVQP